MWMLTWIQKISLTNILRWVLFLPLFFQQMDYFGHKLGVWCKSTIILMELSSPHLCGIHQNLISPVSFGNLYSLVGTLSPCRVWTSRIDIKYCFFNDLMVIVFLFIYQNGPTLSFWSIGVGQQSLVQSQGMTPVSQLFPSYVTSWVNLYSTRTS